MRGLHALILIIISLPLLTQGQCYKYVSPEPYCTKVLTNGDVEVQFSRGSMGGNVSAEIIDRIELEYSLDGIYFNAVASMSIGNKWNNPLKITHLGANALSVPLYYRTVAYCDTLGNYALPTSSMIKSTLLSFVVNTDNDVELSWNYDELAENMLFFINRKRVSDSKYDSIRTMHLQQNQMNFTDNTLETKDTFMYRIDFLNLDFFCQGQSNEVVLIYSPEEVETKIAEHDLSLPRIFPNPASTEVNLSFSSEIKSPTTLELHSIDGKKLWHSELKTGRMDHLIMLPSNLDSGYYWLLVRSKTGQNITPLMIKK